MINEMSSEMEFEYWDFTDAGERILKLKDDLWGDWDIFAYPSVGSNEGYWVDVMEYDEDGARPVIRVKLFNMEHALETCTRINRAILERT